MISKEKLINEMTILLKTKGFKKKKNSWFLYLSETTIVFNVQTSQYDTSLYYINIGTTLNRLNDAKYPSMSSCHIWQRMNLDFKECGQVLKMIEMWIEWYGDIEAIRKKIIEGRMPSTTQKIVYSYFSKF